MATKSNREISAVILAGGKSRRMGKDKRFMNLFNIPLLEYSLNLVKNFTNDIIISSNDNPPGYASYKIVHDLFPDKGPVNAIVSAMKQASNEHVLVLTADMPLLRTEMIEKLLDSSDKNSAVIFSYNKEIIVLPSLFPTSVHIQMEKWFLSGSVSMKSILKKLPLKVLPADEFVAEINFLNINRPEDFERAKAYMKIVPDIEHNS